MKDSSACDSAMDCFLLLDKHQRVPLSVTFHLLQCKKCRTQVRLMSDVEKKLAEPLCVEIPLSDEKLKQILLKIDPSFKAETACPVSLGKWVITGMCLMLAVLLFAVCDYNPDSVKFVSSAVYLVFGVSITIYCTLFIISNMDFFVKKIHITTISSKAVQD